MAAWQEAAAPPVQGKQASAARLEKAHETWDTAITVIDETRKEQAKGPGLQEPAKKALATLDRQWDGLIAHRDYPMAGLDNYADVAVMPMFAVGGGPAAGQGGALAA
jgi:transposase